MSLIGWKAIKNKRYREAEVLVMVAQILISEGYYVKSISNSYQRIDRLRYGFNKICEFTHKGGFDLVILNDEFKETGIEVKSTLGMGSYQSALGQCMVYLNNPDNKPRNAIIFGYKFESDKIYEQIRYDYNRTVAKTGLPLTIRVIQRPLGSYGSKEISRNELSSMWQ